MPLLFAASCGRTAFSRGQLTLSSMWAARRRGTAVLYPYLDTTRLSNDTGFAPTFDVAAAVADYAAWYASNLR